MVLRRLWLGGGRVGCGLAEGSGTARAYAATSGIVVRGTELVYGATRCRKEAEEAERRAKAEKERARMKKAVPSLYNE
eukprot:3605030-Rhodomonas_salina.2